MQINPNSTYHSLLELFEKLSFRQRLRKIVHGLRQPEDSGEYKWAKLQVTRLWSPVSGVIVPLLVVCLMMLISGGRRLDADTTPDVIIIPEEEKPVLDDPPEEPPPVPIDPPDPTVDIITPVEAIHTFSEQIYQQDAGFTKQAKLLLGAQMIRSPVRMVGLRIQRGPIGRMQSLRTWGFPPGSEKAVYAALRWFKKHQEADGSWNATSGGGIGKSRGTATAMTGLVLLTYLAHGETPANSEEFGETVTRGLKWLVDKQGGDGGYDRRYQHAIAAYALCEAYAMTNIPELGAAATRAVDIIIRGQNPQGGWRYKLNPSDVSDSSCMGWCVQALKAARIAGLQNAGLNESMDKAILGFKALYCSRGGDSSMGGFGYTSPSVHGLTGVGVLCNQLLGTGDSREARGGIAHLVATDTFAWEGANWKKLYYWYYNTQVRFFESKETWKSWKDQYAKPLMKAQNVIPEAIRDTKGKNVDFGYWDVQNDRGGRVMDTALCTLMLEVPYRYLGTLDSAKIIAALQHEDNDKHVPAEELPIDVRLQ